MMSYGMYLDQMVGRDEVQYDVRKFHWIGSPERSEVLLYMRSDAPYKSMEDIRKAKTPPKCGSTGTAGTDPAFSQEYRKFVGDDPSPLFPDENQKAIHELPRDAETVALFNKLAGPGPLPPR
jgi:hypothetical protein